MKIQKVTKTRAKLINLNMLETKTSSSKKKHLNYVLRKNIEFRLKNSLNIIFKFHSENKKILFLGTPLKFNKQLKELFKNTNHSFIPENIWLNGILTNTKSIFKFLFKKYFKKNKNNLKFLFNLTGKNNLVVILNESLNQNPLKEFSNKRIPTISLNYNNNGLNRYSSMYRIKQNLNTNINKSVNSLFFSILATTLKKAEKVRKIIIKLNVKKRKLKQNKKKFIIKNAFF